MGTSTPNKGPNSKNPLVPTWLDGSGSDDVEQSAVSQGGQQPVTKPQAEIKPENGQRFKQARTSMNKFIRSADQPAMKSGIRSYVSNTGGKKAAVKRMGSSTKAAGNLLSFLTDVATRGIESAAKSFNLTLMPNESADQLLLRVSDQICEVSTSNVPDAVTRIAYVETVIEMTTKLNITDLNAITPEQITATLGCFIGKSVTERIINEICNNVVSDKANPAQLQETLSQLGGYIEGCASDAIASLTIKGMDIMDTALVGKINEIYSDVFEILESVGSDE
ncbi:hypothetical protein PVK63_14500 [Aliivibrio sp. S2TY2]|uniref:Uncharacterized protein n=1 Tax=Aliivibrio finisterrensis TaxID=511998 RepID=A0ABY0I6V8_9GAMM|nr:MULTISPECIES: Qat anti-phage system associated protein QatB [Aliivibrio]MDD9175929.1 hypothetical protein [Aliivibrio sp. S3TY1]MDD9193156.1 hypothetical protein [Aliivibrio sp. S2TY2]RYU64256.1 hypothetical protein ERW53_09945 [Aliivibrio finisterrensis]RYU83868.1 hypothetical protein ERW52_11785 [Aliivibrio finisterrensis]